MKPPCRLLPLMVVVSVCLFSGVFAYSEMIIGNGINFKTGSGGPIVFDFDITASRIYFEDNYLIILNMNNRYSKIGFSCETTTANMTITKIASDELDYTVNAPTDVTSTTKIYVGSKGRPSDVSGATSWSYNSNLKIVTVNVLHQSPSNIIIEWNEDVVQDFINRAYLPSVDMMGVVLIIIAAILIFSAMQGLPVDTNLIVQALLVTIILSMGIYILTKFTF